MTTKVAPNFDTLAASDHVPVKSVASVLGISVSTVWEWAKKPNSTFPKPKKLGPQATRWNVGELRAWIGARA